MTRKGTGALLALLLAAACASANEPAEPDPVLVEMGEAYFQKYCASCHGAAGRGDGPAAEALGTRPADLTRIAFRRGGRFPESEIARHIDGRFTVAAHGTREMPVWGERLAADVPRSDVAEAVVRGKVLTLVEYLKSIQDRDYLEPAEPSTGE